MEMNIDSIVAACGIATIIINVIGTVALVVITGVQDILRLRRLRQHLRK